ncbi:hypothetical protein H6501_03800 [Candidatus Woesearchaeota archaeon]|nr:hypothetical protein [Nanoarchaeota archaeon]MCB9370695.1 hypothetical protein [Candidatus Woesearchaeota archaeon]USN43779.1 MAG: hypothetical protein H6500_05300 [Candidatus Woesearchaeota archaeon]
MAKNIEVPLNRLVIGFGLIFFLGILFAILNGYYVEESGESLPLIVYAIALTSLLVGAVVILLFQWKINKLQMEKILFLLPKDEAEILACLLEHNNKLEQNHLVAYTGYNKVRISRILTKYEQKGIIEKRNMGNTNLILLKLR